MLNIVMMHIEPFPAHAMGNRKTAAFIETIDQISDQTLRIKEMRKSIVNDDAIKHFS